MKWLVKDVKEVSANTVSFGLSMISHNAVFHNAPELQR